MERIVHELNGASCIAIEEIAPSKKQIMTSRSFGQKLTDYDDLRAAVTHFATRSAEKCRQQKLASRVLTVFIQTSPFDKNAPQYANSATIEFDQPTQDTGQIIAAAQQGLKHIYSQGFHYQKAGILLQDLWNEHQSQLSVFDDEANGSHSPQLMAALDNIKRKHGKQALRYASEMLSDRWRMRQQFKSSSYTTNINELLTINI